MATRVAYILERPIQYQSPLLRLLAREVDLQVFYGSLAGAQEYLDPGFGVRVTWDTPLLDGYSWMWAQSLSLLWRLRHYDVIICHGYNRFLHWMAFLGAHLWRKRLLLRGEITPRNDFWHRWLFAHFDGILAIGTVSKNAALALGMSEERIFWTPYAVDNEWFAKEAARTAYLYRDSIRQQFGWPLDLPVVLFSGKFILRKRPLDLLDACEGLECGVLFVGDGPLRPALEAEIRKRGMRAVVVGFVNQYGMPGHYAAADVVVLPSDYEPWGLVLNEAAACGLPLIATTGVAAARDLINPGQTEAYNGFTYTPGNIKNLRYELGLLLGSSRMREEFGARSREIIKKFSFEQDIKGILAALS